MLKQTGMADVYTDFNGIAQLKSQAKRDPKAAIHETARQFESLFLQMTMKSMRNANAASGNSGLMDGKNAQFFRDMYDQQLAVELSKRTDLGMADMLTQQLGGGKTAAASGGGKTLDSYRATAIPRISGAAYGTELAGDAPRLGNTAGVTSTTSGAKSFGNPEEFVNALWPHAKEAAAEIGVDPKLLLAQAALETGWGKSMMRRSNDQSSHNLFGIKADRSWNGARVTTRTLEYADGVAVQGRAAFRAYQDYGESFKDYVNFLKSNPRYSAALDNAHNPHRFMASLQKAGYATDPSYARKVLSVYKHDAFDKLPA
jgi:flagellar protein FlgJ